MPAIEELYRRYGKDAHFLVVYIREAHPSDGWAMKGRGQPEVRQPRTFEERTSVAGQCSAAMKLSMPVVVDGMDDHTNKCYQAWPDRLAVVAKGGKLVYYGNRGPWGFKPQEVEPPLKKEIERSKLSDDLDKALGEKDAKGEKK